MKIQNLHLREILVPFIAHEAYLFFKKKRLWCKQNISN